MLALFTLLRNWDIYLSLIGLLYVGIYFVATALCHKVIKGEKKVQRAEWTIAGAMALSILSYVFVSKTKTMFFEYAMIAGVVTTCMWWCTFFQISKAGYLAIFGLLMLSTTHGYGMIVEKMTIIPFTFLVIGLTYQKHKTLRNHWMRLWVGIIAFSMHLMVIRELFYCLFKEAYNYISFVVKVSDWIRGMFFVIVGIFFLGLSFGIVKIERKIFTKWLQKVNIVSKKYVSIDYLFLGALILDCFLFAESSELHLIVREYVQIEALSLHSLIQSLILLFLAVQVSYIVLIVTVNEQKVIIRKQDMQQMDMKLYHQRLEENMNEIRAVKHDLRNVFLTMGEFVKRSNDQQMKAYYEEAICPLADQELLMNDCFVALENIGNEPIRAFLYYKISYGISSGVDMKLQVGNPCGNKIWLPEQWELVENFVRILGIWIDNAIEECMLVMQQEEIKPRCLVAIKQDECNLQIKVENTVRAGVIEKGVCVGMTTKGIGRGNGLLYAEKLIASMENCIGNSYFKEQCFVQSMLLDLKGKG